MTPPVPMRLGQQGEQAAADYLAGLGWQILGRNWHCVYGEIDIIARDGAEWVFVEVKTRRSKDTAEAFAQVSRRKQIRIVLAAEQYLSTFDIGNVVWRIDVIAVAFGPGGTVIDHAQDGLLW